MNSAMRDAGQRSGVDFGNAFATGFERQSPRIQSAMLKAADATRKVREETEKLNRAIASGDLDKMTAASNRLTAAHRSHDSALKNLATVQDAASQGGSRLASTLAEVAGAAGKAAGPAALAGLAVGLEGIVGIAAAASGAIGVLPGVLGAAGAGFATAKIGLIGFSDAMDNLSDPEKFAESIGKLAPNAAQAANGIRDLVQGPLKDLQQSTQQALFANVGPQLRQLTATLGPAVQQMTTTVATSLNTMFSGVATQLQNPTTMAAINSTLDSIGAAFRNLAPAAAPLTAAIAELTKVGSGFLPDIAKGATDAATAFSQFVTEASKSGQLKEWIGTGLDTLKQVGPLALDVAKSFLAFAPVGERIMPSIVSTMNGLATILPPILKFVSDIGPLFWVWETAITAVSGAAKLLGDGFNAVSGIVDNVAAKVIPTLNRIGEAISDALAPLRAGAKLVGIDIPEYQPVTGARGGATVGRPGVPGPGTPGFGSSPLTGTGAPGAYGTLGHSAIVPSASGPSWGPPKSVFATTPPTGGSGGSGLPNPATPFSGNPLDVLREAGLTADSTNYGAAQSLLERRHDVEEKRAKVAALEKSNTATADDLTRARNDVMQAEQDAYKAQLSLRDKQIDASQQYLKGLTSTSQAFSDLLDKDFGISKGIPGVVENFTKLLGAMAAAPALSQMGYQPGGSQPTYGEASYGGYGPSYGLPGTGGLPFTPGQSARDFAHETMMPFFQSQGLTVGDHAADKYGEHQNGALDIMVSSIEQGNAVLQQVLSDRNAYGAIFNNQVYGYGQGATPRPYSGGNTGNPTQDHQDHVHALYKPGGANNITSSLPPTIGSPTGGAPPVAPPIGPQPTQMGWGPGGFPAMPAGAGGQGYGPGSVQPGAVGQGAGAPVGGSKPGGWQPQGGGIGQGIAGAAAAAGAMFPGGDVVAAKAGQAIERSVKFGGQLAGIGAQGLMETFSLSSDGAGGDLKSGWLGRLAGGLAQVSPAAPSTAGQTQAPVQPQEHEGSGKAPGPGGGLTINGDFVQGPGQSIDRSIRELQWASGLTGGMWPGRG